MDSFRFDGRKVVLLAGDRRHDYIGQRLAGLGADVWLVRRRPPGFPNLRQSADLAEALNGAETLICPLSPFGPAGQVWSEDPQDAVALSRREFSLLADPSVAFAGSFPAALAIHARQAGCRPVALNEMDEVAILNSIPTAEGALWLALEQATTTLHGSRTVVLGYGRVGQTLTKTLGALGARVTVVARQPESRARAVAAGCEAVSDFNRLACVATGARFVFNTVPALVLTGDVLSRLHSAAVVVDLASGPGGTDFAAAAALGIKATLAPSLPGRVAPEASAGYLAGIMIPIIAESLGFAARAGRAEDEPTR